MYELVREKTTYVISKSENFGSGSPCLNSSSLTPATFAKEIDKATWKEYLLTGNSRREPIKSDVSASWNRCLEMGVDPAHGKCFDIRSENELGAEHRLLKGLVRDTQQEIYALIRGKGLLITICDRYGYLVNMCGDVKALLAADRLNFGPCANWSEKSVGTNAIGTALATGRPMRISGHEHFCESHHGWICSAAPIFDLNGEPIGCIDISGPKSADHHHALALAIEGARAIESRLFRSHSMNLMNTVFNAVMTGLVYVDLTGKIRAANPTAAVLLGTPGPQLVGTDATAWFDLKSVMVRLEEDPGAWSQSGLDVPCLRNRAYGTRAMPVLNPDQTLAAILLVVCERQTHRNVEPFGPPPAQDAFRAILGTSSGIRQAIELARRVAPAQTTVLITGESGTGKEIMARALHDASPRAKHPFVAVNCGAIAPELIQSELFGYVDGAFTGACRGGSIGKFEQASGGTLFLDEIGEMPLAMQVNLLRVLDEKKVFRVGGKTAVPVDVRIVAATNRALDAMVEGGRFRQDLFYRLNVVRINLPPLKQRGSDVHHLAGHFIDIIARTLGRPVKLVDPQFHQRLMAYHWPGNVRELRHAIESAITLMDGDVLRWENLPEPIRGSGPPSPPPDPTIFNLEILQKETIHRAFIHYRGNISKISRALGIGRNTLYAKMKKFDGIQK